MANLIFYTVAGAIIWAVAQALGADFGLALAVSFLIPPLLLIGVLIYKSDEKPF